MTVNPTDEFRAELRDWLEANCPPEMRDGKMTEEGICWGGKDWVFTSEAQKLWLERCAARGYTVPTWPKEYGGAGLTRDQEKIFYAEMDRINARRPLQSFGIWMLGPALLHFGSHEQKLQYLPPIARGEIRWCQGYSEPGAGSDLANVQTRGEDKGDHWLLNGQKIWTSYADKADWIFALVRTDREAPKHKGISFLLVDMDQKGVETRPIKMISGISPFCETFFTDAVVPKHQIVGEVNKGWDVAKYLLTHEREMISGGGAGPVGGWPPAGCGDQGHDARRDGCNPARRRHALRDRQSGDRSDAGALQGPVRSGAGRGRRECHAEIHGHRVEQAAA